jgi:hypothetical protein
LYLNRPKKGNCDNRATKNLFQKGKHNVLQFPTN